MLRVILAKLVAYRSFWRFLALHVLGIVGCFYAGSNFVDLSLKGSVLPIGQWFSLPQAWTTTAAIARWLLYVPAFFTVQVVCAELELRLVRAHVVAGLERRDVVIGWVLQNALLTASGVVASLVAAAVFARGASAEGAYNLVSILHPQLGYALYGIAFLNFAILCAAFMRRPVPSLGLLMLWPLVLEPIVGWAFAKNGYPAVEKYLPFEALGTLVPLPGGGNGFDLSSPFSWLAVAYGVAASLLAWGRLRQLDL